MSTYPNLIVCDHPLVQHALAMMRDGDCPSAQFRLLVNQLATFLTYEALAALPISVIEVDDRQTPSGDTYIGEFIDSSQIVILALMRTAMTMASTVHSLMPGATIGHAGYHRAGDVDFLEPYLIDIPSDLSGKMVLIYDTGMVTGASVASLLRVALEERGADPQRIAIICVITSDKALERLDGLYGRYQIPIFTAACDPGINIGDDDYYARPGVGSFRRRLYGLEKQ